MQLEQILDDYINVVFPFTNKKQYEFKDAMNISLIKYQKAHESDDENNFIIISEDNGFIESFKILFIIIFLNLFRLLEVIQIILLIQLSHYNNI